MSYFLLLYGVTCSWQNSVPFMFFQNKSWAPLCVCVCVCVCVCAHARARAKVRMWMGISSAHRRCVCVCKQRYECGWEFPVPTDGGALPCFLMTFNNWKESLKKPQLHHGNRHRLVLDSDSGERVLASLQLFVHRLDEPTTFRSPSATSTLSAGFRN